MLRYILTVTLLSAPALAADTLVIVSPGMKAEAYDPLLKALQRRGIDTEVLAFSCSTPSLQAHVDLISTRLESQTPPRQVIAEGLGATLALLAADKAAPEEFKVAGPLLSVSQSQVMRTFTTWSAAKTRALSNPLPFGTSTAQDLLFGLPPSALGCLSSSLGSTLSTWSETGPIQFPDVALATPITLTVSLADLFSPLEHTVPASRVFTDRTLLRLGANHLDGLDFSHGALFQHPMAIDALLDAERSRP